MTIKLAGCAAAVILFSLAASSAQSNTSELQRLSDDELDAVVAGNILESAFTNLSEIFDGISLFRGTRDLNEAAENAQNFGTPLRDAIDNLDDPNVDLDQAYEQYRTGFLSSFIELFNAGSRFPGVVAPSIPVPGSDMGY